MELYKRSGLARFVSERSAPLSAPGFSRMIERAAAAAKLGIKAHAHMLRHACGFKLANDGVDAGRNAIVFLREIRRPLYLISAILIGIALSNGPHLTSNPNFRADRLHFGSEDQRRCWSNPAQRSQSPRISQAASLRPLALACGQLCGAPAYKSPQMRYQIRRQELALI
jgi:hypothetical protein